MTETRMNTGVLRLFIFQDIKRPTRSQSRRATTCATPRYFYINFYLISLFSSLLCPPSCGSRNLFGSIVSLDIPTAAPKNARFFCHRQHSRFFAKAGALPPALHLDTAII